MNSHKGPLAEVVPTVVAAEMIITQVNAPAAGGAVALVDLLPAPVLAALDKQEVVGVAAVAEVDWLVGEDGATMYRKVLGTNVYNPPVRNWLDKFVSADGAGAIPLTVEIFYNPYKSDFDTIGSLT